MLNIINDILDFSKIESGKVELDITSFQLDRVIQNVVNIISYKLEEQSIQLRLVKDPAIPDWFFGDAKRIEQVLLNIMNNSVKFTTAGEVSLEIRLQAKEKDTYHLSFIIKDTGIGMNEEQLKQLFEPFTQADVSITRRFGGSGLGLAISKNLIDLMEGTIQVFSTENAGSTFIINMSLRADHASAKEYMKMIPSEHLKHLNILVLSSNADNNATVRTYLHSFGMQCMETTHPVHAMQILETEAKSKPMDLLILDFDVSFDVFQFIDLVRSNDNIPNKPKLMLLLPLVREDLFDKLKTNNIDSGIGKPMIPSVLLNGILDIFEFKHPTSTLPKLERQIPVDSSASYNILVAEDNKTNQLIVKTLLEQAGMTCMMANNGQEAVDLFEQHRDSIDLILMDLHMPLMNGYDASTRIRQLSKDIPIVAMTADVILGVKENCEQHGIYSFISKPFEPEYFITTIQQLLVTRTMLHQERTPVLDDLRGLRNLGNNEDIYRQVLQSYVQENASTMEELEHAIQQMDYAAAAQIVHKLKSSSGSIGANTLFGQSIKFQAALNRGNTEEIISLHTKFKMILEQLLEEIAEYLKIQ